MGAAKALLSRSWAAMKLIYLASFHPIPENIFTLLGVLGGLGGDGGVALSQETRIVAERPALTSCLILNKLLCLPRLIFLICQVK